MKISNETKVGVLSAISITILILGFNFLKGENVFTKENEFVAVYQQVDGLFASNPVLINGYKRIIILSLHLMFILVVISVLVAYIIT